MKKKPFVYKKHFDQNKISQYTKGYTMIPQFTPNFQQQICSPCSCKDCTPSSVLILDLFPNQVPDTGNIINFPINGSDLEPTSQCIDCKSSPEQSFQIEDFPLGRFMRFLKHIKLKRLLSRVTDPRDHKKTKYRIEVILQWVLSVFFFRCESTNALQTAFEKLPAHRKATLWEYFGLPKDSKIPGRTVITDCMSEINQDEINDLLEIILKWAMKSKIFFNHMPILLPTGKWHLACDGVWVHKYATPHAKNELGENICPYCLPRVHNKGKENEYTDYLHAFVNLAFILPNGLQLPIYIYPLKAEQLQDHEASSDEKHKQECELQAAHIVLPIIKQKFPKLPIVFLTDSLYANEPIIQLVKTLYWDYLIVRQVGSLKNVAKVCDELAKTELYKTRYTEKRIIQLKNGVSLEQTFKWFNNITIGKTSFTNVLQFEEIEYNADGFIAKDERGREKRFKTEWLSSEVIHKHNCHTLAKFGRLRADHEDIHNTLKRRGYAAKHDYARANPNACLIWKLIMFVAFFIFELFSFTKLAQESKGSGSWMALAKELLADMTKVPWEKIALSPTLKKEKIQFRFNFNK